MKGWAWEGRCWLHIGLRRELRFEWNLWSRFCALSVRIDRETGGLQLHAALPPISLWLTLPFLFRRERWDSPDVLFDITVHDRALWWQFGGNSMEWSSRTPRWKHGCFHADDFLLGRQRFSEQVLATHDVLIPMPEGAYRATLKLTECEWRRPRWPWPVKRRTAQVEVPRGIPHQGKGENSWDCGEDALYGLSCEAWTVDEAIAKVVAAVLKSRRKYDGNALAVYPPPHVRQGAEAT